MSETPPLEIDVTALKEMRDTGAAHTVIDVREPPELAVCKLPDTLDIRMMEIPESLGKIPKDGALVVMCHSGMRSLQVAQWLRLNGFEHAQSLAGGIDAWAATFDPDMPRY